MAPWNVCGGFTHILSQSPMTRKLSLNQSCNILNRDRVSLGVGGHKPQEPAIEVTELNKISQTHMWKQKDSSHECQCACCKEYYPACENCCIMSSVLMQLTFQNYDKITLMMYQSHLLCLGLTLQNINRKSVIQNRNVEFEKFTKQRRSKERCYRIALQELQIRQIWSFKSGYLKLICFDFYQSLF